MILYKVLIVQQRSCTKCLLYRTCIAQSAYCTKVVFLKCFLYNIGLALSEYCTAEASHKVPIVQHRPYTKYLLYSSGLLQSTSCTEVILLFSIHVDKAQSVYCTVEILHTVPIVQQRPCTNNLLYSSGLSQSTSCTEVILHKDLIVQHTCR